jgi:hypothetical protein
MLVERNPAFYSSLSAPGGGEGRGEVGALRKRQGADLISPPHPAHYVRHPLRPGGEGYLAYRA